MQQRTGFSVRGQCGGYITTVRDIRVFSFKCSSIQEFLVGESHRKFSFEFSRVQWSSIMIEQEMARGLHRVSKC
jgi:hypothetical protein